jgi:hypothetical protein
LDTILPSKPGTFLQTQAHHRNTTWLWQSNHNLTMTCFVTIPFVSLLFFPLLYHQLYTKDNSPSEVFPPETCYSSQQHRKLPSTNISNQAPPCPFFWSNEPLAMISLTLSQYSGLPGCGSERRPHLHVW